MNSQKLLFDASSLIYALKLHKIEVLYDNYIQELTLHEVVNAIWKEVSLIKSIDHDEATKLIKVLSNIVNYMKILSIHPYEQEVLENALKLNLTAYDTSYIILAKKHNLILVTEDSKLRNRARNIIKTTNLKELLTNIHL